MLEGVDYLARVGIESIGGSRPLAYARLAQIHDALGDPRTAVDDYRRFVDLWNEADPALQPRVADARALESKAGRRPQRSGPAPASSGAIRWRPPP